MAYTRNAQRHEHASAGNRDDEALSCHRFRFASPNEQLHAKQCMRDIAWSVREWPVHGSVGPRKKCDGASATIPWLAMTESKSEETVFHIKYWYAKIERWHCVVAAEMTINRSEFFLVLIPCATACSAN
jgi:hypothetical protein